MWQKPLKRDFLEIFRIVVNKDTKVADYSSMNGGEISSQPILKRAINDWEISQVENLWVDYVESNRRGGRGRQ